ncbi:hypothetical protein BH23ACT8_BH23ACT8_21740 [soil metagenome]
MRVGTGAVSPAEARRLLGVPLGADRAAVTRAYRGMARRAHPDAGGDPAAFAALVAARRVLLTRTAAATAGPATVATTPWARRLHRAQARLRRLRGHRRVL